MAGEIINGFDSTHNKEWGPRMVHIETEMFSGYAIPWHRMPGEIALETMTLEEPMRSLQMIKLLKVALSGSASEDVAMLDLMGLGDALSQWVEKSAQLAREETAAEDIEYLHRTSDED